jgi:hypothetical protein
MSQVARQLSRVADLSESDFRKLIDEDTRGKAPASLSAQLRSPECVGRWYETLLAMQKSVEGQLAAKAAESRGAQADFRARLEQTPAREARAIRAEMGYRESKDETWRAGALRFKSGLEEKLIEARRLLREFDDPIVSERTAEERNRALARIATLEDAIRHHRDEFPTDDQPSEIDLFLWSHIGR